MSSPHHWEGQLPPPPSSDILDNDTVIEMASIMSDLPKLSPVASTRGAGANANLTTAQSAPTNSDATGETNNLEQLCKEEMPEVLEKGALVAKRFLMMLHNELGACHKDLGVHPWLAAIQELQKQAEPTRTVVGVVGTTGSGKSSLINAILDEERIVPTNCLRACTALPIEISYNYSDHSFERYRAEIEFLSVDDWIGELKFMLNDMLDSEGNISADATKTDGDASIAYQKFKAVYPTKTKAMITQGVPHNLANEPAVRGILGTTRAFGKQNAEDLYRVLQHYVDSKEKSAADKAGQKSQNTAMEYWPLIKAVRIYTKADALSTGAVIVDLPGTQDANAARAAVSADYIKSCTSIWIVADINRAVDNKTARNLLSDSFKRQLKYDGTYDAVTFICSKTDIISTTEAAESLGLQAELEDYWATSAELQMNMENLKTQISSHRRAKDKIYGQIEELEDEMEDLQELRAQASSDAVTSPSGSRKRKLGSTNEATTEVENKIASIKAQRMELKEKRRSLDGEISTCRKRYDSTSEKLDLTLAKGTSVCIKGRNDYSTYAIKQDFAMGIKELDDEAAEEQELYGSSPIQREVRDYDAVARALPVFCVSARAYQNLCGRLEKDKIQSHGFLSLGDTGIPGLQNHAKKLTEAVRVRHARRFLNGVAQLINSLKLWCAKDAFLSNLTEEEKRETDAYLKRLVKKLEQDLEVSCQLTMVHIGISITDNVYRMFEASIPQAILVAPGIARGWGAPRSEGGLAFPTYRATVARRGVFSGAAGPRDFNQELFNPIGRNLMNGWDTCFQNRIPALLQNYTTEVDSTLEKFHNAVKAQVQLRNSNVPGLSTLSKQIAAHKRSVQDLQAHIAQAIADIQRETNRQFTEPIAREMGPAYESCLQETGIGTHMRMKAIMDTHVEAVRHVMFYQASGDLKTRLEDMCTTVEKTITAAADRIVDTIRNDYMRTLVGIGSDMPPERREEELRQINALLRESDLWFGRVINESGLENDVHMEG
ncbi:hypothetical protein GGS20DRAFT_593646 [Poronia punctata]|nr:hypothetical protein GGS20DRAFT_593646 [Poronia punctata]